MGHCVVRLNDEVLWHVRSFPLANVCHLLDSPKQHLQETICPMRHLLRRQVERSAIPMGNRTCKHHPWPREVKVLARPMPRIPWPCKFGLVHRIDYDDQDVLMKSRSVPERPVQATVCILVGIMLLERKGGSVTGPSTCVVPMHSLRELKACLTLCVL